MIGAATEDCESTGDDEPDQNDEPSLGSLDKKSSQVNWGSGSSNDAELEAADLEVVDEREPEEADQLIWAPNWPPKLPVFEAAD